MAIRKASRQYNSDYMSRLCDDELEQLEEKLTALYANANNIVLADYEKWMSHYKANYNEMCAKLEADEITKKEFQEWVERRMVDNKLFTKTIESMTDVLVNTDITAMALLNDELPLIIAQSYNFVQSLGFAAADEAGLSVGTFQIYNARTVQALIKDNPDILKYVNKEKDYTFNKERINNEITHSILNGDSIQKTANRLQNVSSMDENSAIRAARTAMTAAENLGRNESFHDLKEKGIPSKLQWSATHDSRTRDTHILLDGQYQDEDGYFRVEGYEIQYPGDPAAEPEMIYNCRCRASLRLEGVDHSQDGDLYEKFMKENYPDDWNNIKGGIEKKEKEFQNKKEGAAERIEAKNQNKIEEMQDKKQEPEYKIDIPEKVEKTLDKFESKYYDSKKEHSMLIGEDGEVIYEDSGKKDSTHFAPSYSFAESLPSNTYSIHNHPANELFSWQDINNYEKYGTHGIITTPDGYEHLLFNLNDPKWEDYQKEGISAGGLSMAWSEAVDKIGDEWLQERRAYFDSISELPREEQRSLARQWDEQNSRIDRYITWLEENAEKYGFIYRREKI